MAETGNELTKHINQSNNPRADLHLHTTYSDGALSPEKIVQRAQSAGLTIISITDHDNVGALDEAIEAGKKLGVEIVPGVELSVTLNEKDIHLLAYFFDYKNQKLQDYLAFFRYERLKRAERIVQKLNDIHISLDMDAVLNQAGIGSVGRPHIASALLEEGLIDTYHEAFMKYIGVGAPAYEKKYQLSPNEATQLIAQAGGLTFLAHPGKYTTELELSTLIQAGVDGIEVVHPSHNEARQEFYRGVIHQYFLLECGGSDYHGGRKNDDQVLGVYTVPLQVVEDMRTRLFS
ncbi:MAG: PHP domain-containing protein [Ignavibacteriae bacterium]|nr:MAG: PHP domain-containing protein [Ignavibacteriota bacterium]